MSMFELILVGLVLMMLTIMLLIARWIMIIMINSRLIHKKLEHHNRIDLELRFFRFLHFNGYEKKESGKFYLSKILNNFIDSNIFDDKEKDSYKEIYDTFLKNHKT